MRCCHVRESNIGGFLVVSVNTKRLTSRRRLLTVAGLGVLAVPVAALPVRYQGQFYPGTTVAGVRLNGLTQQEALVELHRYFAPYEQRAARFGFEGQYWLATLAELGGTIDYEATLEIAMSHGRESVADRYTEFFAPDDAVIIEPVVKFDQAVARKFMESIAPAIDIEARNARLYRESGEIQMVDSQEGRALDRDAAITDLERGVAVATYVEIDLQTNTVTPEVTSEQLEPNKNQAITLIGEAVYLTYDGLTYPISAEDLAQALVIDDDSKPQIDPTNLKSRLDAIQAAVYVPPKNVMLGWDSGLYVVKDDVDGIEMDREATEALVRQLASSAERTAEMPTQVAKAKARVDNMKELGLEQHLAYGSSSFAGSSWERATNVGVAANNISYKLVAPGELFSFNALLGPISTDMGFVSGTIINGDWTATDIGGGVCQVSTTVFRAAARAGFQFTEWHAHSWRLGFYELDGSPPGFDAAIYQPNSADEITKDLSFYNTLDSWLLLMMIVDGDTVYAHLYGTDPGWVVTFGDVWVSDPIEPGKPVERLNAELARGERRFVSSAHPGYQVVLPRKVVAADGTIISDGNFVSDFRAQPETWEVGPT